MLYQFQKWLKYLALKQSIKETGTIVPLLVMEDGTLLDGKTRNRIAKELGLQIPVIVLPFKIEYREPGDLIDPLEHST